MKYDVFISYCHCDFNIAKNLHSALAREGTTSYIDASDLRYGADFASSIVSGIQGTNVFICLYGKESPNSQWQKHEIEFAIEESKRHKKYFIIPILISQDVKNDLYNNYALREYHIIDYRSGIDEIVNQIAILVSRNVSAQPLPISPNSTCEKNARTHKPNSNEPRNYKPAQHRASKRLGCYTIVGVLFIILLIVGVYMTFVMDSPQPYPYPTEQPDDEDILHIDDSAMDDWLVCDTVCADSCAVDVFPSEER